MDLFFWRNVDEHNTWKRTKGGVASVITGEELSGITWQTFVVLPGTRALFIDNGMNQGELESGKYTAESLYQRFTQLRLKSAVRIMVYDCGDIHLEYSTGRKFYTKENVKTGGNLHFVVKIDDGLLFHNNFLKERKEITKAEIIDFLQGEIDHVISGFIVQQGFADLYGNLDLRRELQNKLEAEMRTSLRRIGVDLVQIPYLDYDEGAWEEMKDKSGELELARMKMKVEIDARNLEYERTRQNTELKLREELLEQEFAIKEDIARARMSQQGAEEMEEVTQEKRLLGLKILSRETAAKMQSLNTEEEKKNFLDRLDEKRSLSEQQRFEVLRAIDESNQDHDMARELFVNKTKLLNKQEFDFLHQRYLHELKAQSLRNDKEILNLTNDLKRQNAINELEIEKIIVDAQWSRDAVKIALQQRQKDFEREQKKKDALLEEELKRQGIDTDVYRKAREIELYGQMKKAKLEAKAQEQLIDERARDAAHARDMERLKTMNELGPAALAATADDNERAAMLAQLARTEAFKGMDPEAILAASASDNPEVAKAFQEKFRLAALQTEKMLEMKDQHIKDVKDMGMGAQNIMGNVEMTRAANPVHTNVAMSGMGGLAAWPGVMAPMMQPPQQGQAAQPTAEEKKFCTKCGQQQPKSAKFCNACGYEFPGT